MNIHKESIYNIKSVTDGHLSILNSLNGNFVKFDKEITNRVISQLEHPNQTMDKDVMSILLENNFIINHEQCEQESLEEMREGIIGNTDQLNLIILPTEKCNFRCKYCYENFEQKQMDEKVQEDLLVFVKKNIKGHRKLNVEWFGGEPLLSLGVIEKLSKQLIEICREHHVMYGAGITTNGYYLTPENIEKLRKCKVNTYQITLDGLQATHDKQRVLYNGKETWEKIVSNLRYIRDHVKSGLIQITIRTNLTKEIYNDYKNYMAFLESEFKSDRRFSYLIRLASDWGNLQEEQIKEKFCDEDEYFEVLKYTLEKGFLNVGAKMAISPGGLLCYAWKKGTVMIRADGVVGKCTLNLYDQVNQIDYIKNFSLGPQSQRGFWDPDAVGKPDKCASCSKYPICLKVDCNMATRSEAECDIDIKRLEEILPYINNSSYGCLEITKKDV